MPPYPGMSIKQIFHWQVSHISSPKGETISFSNTRVLAGLVGLGVGGHSAPVLLFSLFESIIVEKEK